MRRLECSKTIHTKFLHDIPTQYTTRRGRPCCYMRLSLNTYVCLLSRPSVRIIPWVDLLESLLPICRSLGGSRLLNHTLLRNRDFHNCNYMNVFLTYRASKKLQVFQYPETCIMLVISASSSVSGTSHRLSKALLLWVLSGRSEASHARYDC